MLRLAREYNLLPCKYINVPRDPEVDFLLTMALDIHDKDLLCVCGAYREDCQSGEGWYEIDDSNICFKRAALEEFQKENTDLEPGTMPIVVDTRLTEAPERTQRHTAGKKPEPITDDTLG